MATNQTEKLVHGSQLKQCNPNAELIAQTNVLPVARFVFINGLCWYRALALTAIQRYIEQLLLLLIVMKAPAKRK
ncbi:MULTISPECIES: hypothetical protein [unclassified Synechococcus]|uniref:hypothetical protein n=1 Tax=unclassified Synechococcus TaxID=2626047 RepID=UPI000A98E786|nr:MULTISPECIES: hypothetical protein [unclassified Synechococcus]